ncbi:MAG: S-adenosylmethionine:tRNA ribosyltransferase-isomerase, partial [Paracoccaceae bacterium]
MKLSDFDFDLPESLIATRPARPRSSARLLVAHGDQISDQSVRDLTQWLRPGDRLVLNDTRVIPARLSGTRARISEQGHTQAKIDVTVLEPNADGTWAALLKPLKKVHIGETVDFSDGFSAVLDRVSEGQGHLRFNLDADAFDEALAQSGAMPLPP